MRQHVGPAPAGIIVVAAQHRVPFVVVGRAPAHIDLRVHRGAAAEDVALRNVVHASAELLLRHGVVIAHELAAVDHLEDARRHVDERMAMRMSRLQQQHARPALLDETRRRDAA